MDILPYISFYGSVHLRISFLFSFHSEFQFSLHFIK